MMFIFMRHVCELIVGYDPKKASRRESDILMEFLIKYGGASYTIDGTENSKILIYSPELFPYDTIKKELYGIKIISFKEVKEE